MALAHARAGAAGCVLPSGRVAVVGGKSSELQHDHGEAFDPETRTWQPLTPMAHARGEPAVVAVAGGMLAVGGAVGANPDDEGELPPAELFDEASGRWFELPHPMAEPRRTCSAVSLPATALAPAPAAP